MEPLGGAPLGTTNRIAAALTLHIAQQSETLFVPPLHFGCSIPFMAFAGTSGVKQRTLSNTLLELCEGWKHHGVQTIVILDCMFENREAIDYALHRLSLRRLAPKTVLLRWYEDSAIRKFIATELNAGERGRPEWALLSMGAWLSGKSFDAIDIPEQQSLRQVEWRKRGADPDRFKKLFPHALCSSLAKKHNPEDGHRLFEFIVQRFVSLLQTSAA
jgi:hypothetical protein